MLRAVGELLDSVFGPAADAADDAHALQLATAALLVEVARADTATLNLEQDTMTRLLRERFALSETETQALLSAGETRADQAVSLQKFTRLLHEQLSEEEKAHIVEMLWQVAYADAALDKYEDNLVRKIAALLYLPDSEVIRLRNKVRGD